jgi:hypothetical protein
MRRKWDSLILKNKDYDKKERGKQDNSGTMISVSVQLSQKKFM